MAEGKLTKKELKELRKLERLQKQNLEQKNSNMRFIVISIVSVLFLVLFVGLVVFTKESRQANEANTDAPVVANLTPEGMLKGPENAVVQIVEFADFQCPACAAYHPVVKELLDRYPEQVSLLYKHFPIPSIHRNAIPAGVAAEAAGVQGKFFEMHDILFTRQQEWANEGNPNEIFISYAQELGLNVEQFEEDLGRDDLRAKVETQREEGINNGVNSTPTFFVNSVKIQNPNSIEEFSEIIDGELAKQGVVEAVTPSEATSAAESTAELELQ